MNHLEYAKQTYFQHFKDAAYYSWTSYKASFYFFLHAISPNHFQKSGSETIKSLNDILIQKYNELNPSN